MTAPTAPLELLEFFTYSDDVGYLACAASTLSTKVQLPRRIKAIWPGDKKQKLTVRFMEKVSKG